MSTETIELRPIGQAEDIDKQTPELTGDEDEANYPTGAQFWLICLAVSFVLILGGMDASIVSTAVPRITDHFHTVADVGWYYTAYRLTTCAFQFMFGKMYKIYPLKVVFLAEVAIFMMGSTICATAATSKMFILGRAVTGLGASGVIAGCFTLLVYLLPLRKRPVFTGMFGAVEAVATIVAPILGGVLTQDLSWRWCFWISLPVGGVTFILLAIFLPAIPIAAQDEMNWKEKLGQLDLIGNLFFVPAITLLFIALSWAGVTYPWSDPKIIGLLVTFAVLLGGFVWDQIKRQEKATLPPRILKQRSVIAGFIFSMCCNGSASILEYYAPTYFQVVKEFTPAKSGIFMLPGVIGSMIGFLICGSGTTISGFYTPFMITGSVLMPVAAGLMTTWAVDTKIVELILYLGLVGFATGIGFQGPQSAVQSTLPKADASLGLSIIIFAQGFGPALFVSIAQTVFTNRLTDNLHRILPDINSKSVENLGFSELKASVGPQNLTKALVGFDESLVQTWYLAIGVTCITLIGSLMMEWRSVKQKTT